MPDDASLATGQRSLADPSVTYPLAPPLAAGCPETSTDEVQYPADVAYDYDAVDPGLFEAPLRSGLERWAPLLPPLDPDTDLGEGNTPLLELPSLAARCDLACDVYVKDESANPTWSHKDRSNRCVASAAVDCEDAGLVVSSSGNNGASAAAYAARADLPCVVLADHDLSESARRFLGAYDAAVLRVDDWDARREAVDRLAADHGFHAASTRTRVPTGHPYGAEGYRTVAYELFVQFGERTPGTVFVPTGFAELLFGVAKGFRELRDLGVAARTPRVVACEPAARAPLAAARAADRDVATVDPAPTDADAIRATTNGYRGTWALEACDGYARPVSDERLETAQRLLAGDGLWQELSAAAGVAGLLAAADDGDPIGGPVVCLATSGGFTDASASSLPAAESDWSSIRDALRTEYDLDLSP